VFASQTGELACVVAAGPWLSVVAVGDGRPLGAPVEAPFLAPLALVTPDLSRMLVASGERLALLDARDGTRLAEHRLGSYEPTAVALGADPSGEVFKVRFRHVEHDILPTISDVFLDALTLAPLPPAAAERFSPFPQGSPFRAVTLEIAGRLAELWLPGRRLLAALRGHEWNISTALWHGTTLLTADGSGAILRWDIDVDLLLSERHHERRVARVLAAGRSGVVLSAAERPGGTEVKLWKDRLPVASFAASGELALDDERGVVVEQGPTLLLRSLSDGAELGRVELGAPPARLGPRGRLAAQVADLFALRLVDLASGSTEAFPARACGILSASCPPLFHPDGRRLLVSTYGAPARLWSMAPLTPLAERELHRFGTAWVALHPDGETLLSAGHSDGLFSVSDFHTLEARRSVRVFEGDPAIVACALLPGRGEALVAGKGHLARVPIRDPGVFAKIHDLMRPSLCPIDAAVSEMIAAPGEASVVLFFEKSPPRHLDVETLRMRDATAAEAAEAAPRRRREADGQPFGLERAHSSPDNRWLLGWRRGLLVSPRGLDGRPAREPLQITEIDGETDLVATLIDEENSALWLLRSREGALLRVSLADPRGAVSLVATLPDPRKLHAVDADTLAVQGHDGTLHVFRHGAPLLTLPGFAPNLTPCFGYPSVLLPRPAGWLRLGRLDTGEITDLAPPHASPQATRVACAHPHAATLHDHGTVYLWNLDRREVIGAWRSVDEVTALDVRPDGLVTVGDLAGRVTLLRMP